MTVGQLDCGPGRIYADIHRVFAEIEEWDRTDEEDKQDRDRKQSDNHRDHERQLDAARVEADEDDVTRDPPERLERGRRLEDRGEISPDEVDDHGRRQHVFDILGNAGNEAAPWPERRSRKRISAAGMRQRGAHLGDGIGEAEIHDGDDDRGDEHAAPTADREAKVPAGKISRNDCAHAERP